MNENNKTIRELNLIATAVDPIYIGTGGYTIGRVDNTIVRDPITRLPKIPGSSLAGTWRYYVALELQSKVKDKKPDFSEIKNLTLEGDDNKYLWKKIKKYVEDNQLFKDLDKDWLKYYGNATAMITCAGQDNMAQERLEDSPLAKDEKGKTGHCGYCIVCKSFGFAKKDISWQGMLFFSDLEILLFPVYTRLGVRWITTSAKINADISPDNREKILTASGNEGTLNLGWMNLKVAGKHELKEGIAAIETKNIIIVHEDIFSHIVNSNLEVRTSVSIDPLTGAAKEGALFTSEAIPRATVFTGTIRIFDKSAFEGINEIGVLPSADMIEQALKDTAKYYESLGIGGMTTRGFGRMKIEMAEINEGNKKNSREEEINSDVDTDKTGIKILGKIDLDKIN